MALFPTLTPEEAQTNPLAPGLTNQQAASAFGAKLDPNVDPNAQFKPGGIVGNATNVIQNAGAFLKAVSDPTTYERAAFIILGGLLLILGLYLAANASKYGELTRALATSTAARPARLAAAAGA